jgi:hypothetical protein
VATGRNAGVWLQLLVTPAQTPFGHATAGATRLRAEGASVGAPCRIPARRHSLRAKQSFAPKGMPKWSLGTRGEEEALLRSDGWFGDRNVAAPWHRRSGCPPPLAPTERCPPGWFSPLDRGGAHSDSPRAMATALSPQRNPPGLSRWHGVIGAEGVPRALSGAKKLAAT